MNVISMSNINARGVFDKMHYFHKTKLSISGNMGVPILKSEISIKQFRGVGLEFCDQIETGAGICVISQNALLHRCMN